MKSLERKWSGDSSKRDWTIRPIRRKIRPRDGVMSGPSNQLRRRQQPRPRQRRRSRLHGSSVECSTISRRRRVSPGDVVLGCSLPHDQRRDVRPPLEEVIQDAVQLRTDHRRRVHRWCPLNCPHSTSLPTVRLCRTGPRPPEVPSAPEMTVALGGNAFRANTRGDDELPTL